jgi:hypothetical protein
VEALLRPFDPLPARSASQEYWFQQISQRVCERLIACAAGLEKAPIGGATGARNAGEPTSGPCRIIAGDSESTAESSGKLLDRLFRAVGDSANAKPPAGSWSMPGQGLRKGTGQRGPVHNHHATKSLANSQWGRSRQGTALSLCSPRPTSAAVGVEFCEQSCYRAHSAQEHAMADDPPPRSDLSDEEVRRMVMSIRQQLKDSEGQEAASTIAKRRGLWFRWFWWWPFR